MSNMKVRLEEVWRDKGLYEEMKAEIFKQKIMGWHPWEILLPPDLLWPMLEEVSQGMVMQWTPSILDTPVQVGAQSEIGIRFVRKEEKESPVLYRSMKYNPEKSDYVVPVEVNNGSKIRV